MTGKFNRACKCARHKNHKVKMRLKYKCVWNVVRNIHEARSRRSHPQSVHLSFPSKIFSQWPLQPLPASFSFHWSTPLYPPYPKTWALLPSSCHFIFICLLITLLSTHLSILTKAAHVSVCKSGCIHDHAVCCVSQTISIYSYLFAPVS